MDWIFVDLMMMHQHNARVSNVYWSTFAILALKKLLSKNFTLSSSVCNMTSLKFDDGSNLPVMSSIVSIWFLMPSLARWMRSVGYGRSSGDVLSLIHARVKACKSSVRWGTSGADTDARRSEMSIAVEWCATK